MASYLSSKRPPTPPLRPETRPRLLQAIRPTDVVTVVPIAEKDIDSLDYTDRFVVLMGPTGSGKSSFIEALAAPSRRSEGPMGISKDQLESVTKNVQIYLIRNIEDRMGSQVYIIDTPGLADPSISELQVLTKLKFWRNKCNEDRPVNFLYFHPITDIRMPSSKKLCIEMSKSFWGPYNIPATALVLSMWDRLKPEMRGRAEERYRDLSNNYWQICIKDGSSVVKFENTYQSAMEILRGAIGVHDTIYRYPNLPRARGLGTAEEGQSGLVVEGVLKDRIMRLQQQIQAVNDDLNDPETQKNEELMKILRNSRNTALNTVATFNNQLNALKSPFHRVFYEYKERRLQARVRRRAQESASL